jgi:hypothetical protein
LRLANTKSRAPPATTGFGLEIAVAGDTSSAAGQVSICTDDHPDGVASRERPESPYVLTMTTDAHGPYREPVGAPAARNSSPGNVRDALSPTRLLPSAALAAAGVVFGAFVVVAGLSSDRGFEWKTFLSMAALTICFAGGAALSWLDTGRPVPASRLTGLLGALAIASLGLLVLSSWDGSGWVYGSSLMMVAAGAAAYWVLREDLLTLPVVFGAVIFVSQAYSDVVGDDDSGTGAILAFGIVLVVLGAVIVAAGWPFACRHLTGALGSIVAVGAMVLVLILIGLARLFVRAFAGVGGGGSGFAHSDRDLWIALFLGIAVSLAVAGLGAISGLDRYLVIAFTGATLCTLIGVVTATREHPLRTAAVFAFVAGLVVAAAVLGDRIYPKPSWTAPHAEGPPVVTPPPPAASTPPPPVEPGSMPPPPAPSATTETATMPPVDPAPPPPPTRDPGSPTGPPPPA